MMVSSLLLVDGVGVGVWVMVVLEWMVDEGC